MNSFEIGNRIIYEDHLGTIKFIGSTTLSEQTWYGIELEEKVGENNGTIRGIKYFEGKEGYCKFVLGEDIISLSAPKTPRKKKNNKLKRKSRSFKTLNYKHKDFTTSSLSDLNLHKKKKKKRSKSKNKSKSKSKSKSKNKNKNRNQNRVNLRNARTPPMKKTISSTSIEQEFVRVSPVLKNFQKNRLVNVMRRSRSVNRDSTTPKNENQWQPVLVAELQSKKKKTRSLKKTFKKSKKSHKKKTKPNQNNKYFEEIQAKYSKKSISSIENALKKISLETEKKLKIKKELQKEFSYCSQELLNLKCRDTNEKELSEKELSEIEKDHKEEVELEKLLEEIEQLKDQEKKADLGEKKINQQIMQFHKFLSSVGNPELSDRLIKKQKEVMKATYFYQELIDRKLLLTKEIQQTKSLINQSKRSHRIEMDDLKKILIILQTEIKKAKERKKHFGSMETQSKINVNQLLEKLESLNNKKNIIKRRKLDLEIDKDKFSSKMDIVLEYRDKIDRNDWTTKLITRNPEIKDLRERIDPLRRAIAFAQYYGSSKVQLNKHLTKQIINQLIMQHLEFENRKECRKIIEKTTFTIYNNIQLRDSRLSTLFRISLREIENLWDILMTNNSKLNLTLEEKNNILETKVDEMGLEMFIDKNDVNIWEEPPDNPNNIVFKENDNHKITNNIKNNVINSSFMNKDIKGEQNEMMNNDQANLGETEKEREKPFETLHCANINKLIEKLTDKKTEVQYRDAFLMTYQSFMKPGYLFAKLKERYNVPHLKMEDWIIFKDTIQIRVISVLNSWIKLCWADIDEKLLFRIVEFINNTIVTERNASSKKLLKLIDDMKEQKQMTSSSTFKGQIPEAIVPKNLFSPNFTLLDVCEEEFARQYTLYICELFQKIKPSELVTEAWQKKALKSKATNVLALINKFNELSGFIATIIVTPNSVKERAKMYSKFLKIGRHLLDIQNYDSLMSIVAGYMHSGVKRLKLTISEVPKNIIKYFHEFKSILSHEKGYRTFRELLDRKEPPLIPYLGMFLTDITFISTGSPDKVNGLINFTKRKLLYNVVSKIQEYQRVSYKFFPIHQIQVLFRKKLYSIGEKELYHLSLKREPRN
ncbi:ras guanine nucleotide exchange factor i-related [Anaeramoeba flamelloides]|uniref:Ras guanine nucleotide exchange factor i-related n=1 Tax=Anaeramoeba flamelloides TaxID=1746091 RepID=A0AAV7ZJH4_9EUKA|nr:ras guanine nucleotide exchange factor i-related [Anaeramoeba flamelloides]